MRCISQTENIFLSGAATTASTHAGGDADER